MGLRELIDKIEMIDDEYAILRGINLPVDLTLAESFHIKYLQELNSLVERHNTHLETLYKIYKKPIRKK